MSAYRKVNGQMISVTTEGHPQYYFDTLAQAEQALSQLPEGSDVFVKEGSNEDLLPRVEQAEEDIVQINSDLSNKQDLLDKGQVSGVNIDNVGGSGGVGIGCYFLYSGSTSGTQPVSGNYILISLKAGTTFQIALPYNVAGHTMMVRMYVNNVWTAWKDV